MIGDLALLDDDLRTIKKSKMAMVPDSRGATPTVKKGKIIDMIGEWQSKTEHPFISFEYFPPKTPEGVEKLHKVIDTMAKQDPLFMDFTWGAGGTTSELTLDLSKESQSRHNVMVNMHLTCTNQVKETCDFGLEGAKSAGICNIVALRGDPPKGQEKWEVTEGGFACALDLCKYMRQLRRLLLHPGGGLPRGPPRPHQAGQGAGPPADGRREGAPRRVRRRGVRVLRRRHG